MLLLSHICSVSLWYDILLRRSLFSRPLRSFSKHASLALCLVQVIQGSSLAQALHFRLVLDVIIVSIKCGDGSQERPPCCASWYNFLGATSPTSRGLDLWLSGSSIVQYFLCLVVVHNAILCRTARQSRSDDPKLLGCRLVTH